VGSLCFLLVGEGEEEEQDDVTAAATGDVLRIPYSEVILLFDNTYSWFKPKHIR
jgi:hypothetical protein